MHCQITSPKALRAGQATAAARDVTAVQHVLVGFVGCLVARVAFGCLRWCDVWEADVEYEFLGN